MDKNAFVVEFNNKPEYQRLMMAPQTCGMKAGRVWLGAGQECGLHSTEAREELLVFLQGEGIAKIGEDSLVIGQGRVCYIPPRTQHNIINTGSQPLVYVFCVTPVDG